MAHLDANSRCVVIGAGPAGLTAAYELMMRGVPAIVFEADGLVGGIARTNCYKGYRFDIGGHRFFTKVGAVEQLWQDWLGPDLLQRARLSRIYYNGRYFSYPIHAFEALVGLGPFEAARIAASLFLAKISPIKDERSFQDWVTNRFGKRLFSIFFKSYTEKVWGLPCTEIGADWAAQRIKNLDLVETMRSALFGPRRGVKTVTSLIEQFSYPRLGPGMMWERCQAQLASGGIPTYLSTQVIKVHHEGPRAVGVTVRSGGDAERFEHADALISSMPLRDFVRALDPPAPTDILAAASALRYRDFLTVMLVVDRPNMFADQWIYIHAPEVRVGRIQNFKNWSSDMVPDQGKTSLGLEYFLWSEDDPLWRAPDAELVELGRKELALLGLAPEEQVLDGCVVRMPRAYPVYDRGYRTAVERLRGFLRKFDNIESVGRNGQHRYNNQDHSMLTAMCAVRALMGEGLDCWTVNVEDEYHEQATVQEHASSGERRTPLRLAEGG